MTNKYNNINEKKNKNNGRISNGKNIKSNSDVLQTEQNEAKKKTTNKQKENRSNSIKKLVR